MNAVKKRGYFHAGRLLFACLLSYSVLAVCSKSSFLYPMNDWVDVHCFFTVGRGVLHGLTPYRDLYEQKGPLVYFFYALAAQISEGSFLGVYLLEGLCFAAFVHLGGKTAALLSGRSAAYWPAAAALALIVPVTPAFSHGSSAEELFLPLLMAGLYLVMKAMHEKRPLSDRRGFAIGLCAAAALWTKYTFCGLFLGLALAVALWYLVARRGKGLLRLIGFFLLGCLAVSLAVAGYFAWKGALGDLWRAYFVNNLTQYGQNIRGGVYDPPLVNLKNNLPWSIPGALGLLWLALGAKKRGWEALAAWLSAICLFAATYWSGRRYPYYALVLSVYAPLGLGAAAAGLGWLFDRLRFGRERLAALALAGALLLLNPWTALRVSRNTYLMQVPREDMPPYRFARIIRQSEDQSLLNYGFLDGGFYFAAGVQPAGPYFCTLNISLPDMEKALDDSIRQGKTAFVVTRSRPLQDSGPYRLVDEAEMTFEGRVWKYYLYQRSGGDASPGQA